MLEIKNISKSYKDREIFKNISYSFKDNGIYTILGKSGVGKTTFLNILSLLEKSDEGELIFNGINLFTLNENKKREFRLENIAFIFQSFNLFENDTVFNNVYLTLDASMEAKESIKKDKVYDMLKYLDIFSIRNSLVKNLSGGEKQRVAIARSLINNPSIIFADEPSGSLDNENSKIVFDILKDLSLDHLVIIVSHNEDLAYQYSDYILRLNKDKIVEEKLENNIKKSRFLLSKIKNKTKEKRINFSFKFAHFKNLLSSKKARMVATISFLSFSFLISGLTIFIKDGMSSILKSSFESLSGENSLLLKRKNDDSSILSYYSASKEDVTSIMVNNDNEIDYVGCTYLNNFNEFFIEENSLYLDPNNRQIKDKIKLDDYNALSFNEFEYVSTFKNFGTIYPSIGNRIKDDEVVISLSNEKMIELCKKLEINETYIDLGNYIKEYKPYLILKIQNDYWTYVDEQLFDLKAIIPSRENKIYSSNYFFNEYVFEEKMRFPSSNIIEKEEEYPRILKKVYYFHTLDFPSSIINKLNKEVSYKNYIFDNDKSFYNPNIDETYTNKVYCFQSLKNTINFDFIEEVASFYNFNSYYYSTDGGYVNFGSILNGFYRPTFFATNKEKINEIIDLNTKISYDDYYSLDGMKDVAIGNYLKQGDDIVHFSPKMNKSISGYYPKNVNEIAISKRLAEQINCTDYLNQSLYISTITEVKTNDDESLLPIFKTIKLKITGIVDSSKSEIYHDNDFSISLFRDLFSISSFELNVNSVTFLLDQKLTESDLTILNKSLTDYEFILPLKEVNESIEEIMNYVYLVLLIFSIVSLISSLILFSIINYISFLEEKREVAILILLGFSNKEIIKYFLFNNLIIGLISFIISSFSLIFISFIINKIIKIMIGVSTSFFFSFTSILIMLILLILIALISLIMILKPLIKIDIKKELH